MPEHQRCVQWDLYFLCYASSECPGFFFKRIKTTSIQEKKVKHPNKNPLWKQHTIIAYDCLVRQKCKMWLSHALWLKLLKQQQQDTWGKRGIHRIANGKCVGALGFWRILFSISQGLRSILFNDRKFLLKKSNYWFSGSWGADSTAEPPGELVQDAHPEVSSHRRQSPRCE